MVYNGIEYGMMQAYGEGFNILDASPYAESLNYAELSHLWNRGSVVSSWLLELYEREPFDPDWRITKKGTSYQGIFSFLPALRRVIISSAGSGLLMR